MKSGLNYWYGTKSEMEAIENKCFQSYIAGMDNSADYKSTTTAFTRVFKPAGEGDIWAMRIPSGIVKKQSLINTMTAHNKDIKTVTSKKAWSNEE